MIENLRSIDQLTKETMFTEGQLRGLVFNAATNGMKEFDVVKRYGRRVFIDTVAFEKWIESQSQKKSR